MRQEGSPNYRGQGNRRFFQDQGGGTRRGQEAVYGVNGAVAEAVTGGYIPISIIDLPLADPTEPLIRWRFDRPVTFVAGTADAEIAAAAPADLRIRKNGASNGTVSFTGTSGAVSFSDLVYGAGDLFELYPPASVDASLDRVSVTLQTT